jgi:hypothetical protein
VKSEGLARHVLFAATVTLALYAAGFTWIEHLNRRHGPWEIEFRTDAEGHLSLTVNQAALGISNLTVSVPDQTVAQSNLSATVRFDNVTNTAPVGELVYFDTRTLPGVLTFNLLGHEVEFMPRTMTVDKEAVAWTSNTNIVLTGAGKYVPKPPKKIRY